MGLDKFVYLVVLIGTKSNRSERNGLAARSMIDLIDVKFNGTSRELHLQNDRTVEQLPLAASHPPLGCRPFIPWSHFLYAFWVTMNL